MFEMICTLPFRLALPPPRGEPVRQVVAVTVPGCGSAGVSPGVDPGGPQMPGADGKPPASIRSIRPAGGDTDSWRDS